MVIANLKTIAAQFQKSMNKSMSDLERDAKSMKQLGADMAKYLSKQQNEGSST